LNIGFGGEEGRADLRRAESAEGFERQCDPCLRRQRRNDNR
jgi:hypothetical protein